MSSSTVSPSPYPNNRLSLEDEKKNVSEVIKPLIEWIEKNHFSDSVCFPEIDPLIVQEKIDKILSFSVWAVIPYGPISWKEILEAVSRFNPTAYLCGKDALRFLGVEYCKNTLDAWGIPKDKVESTFTFSNFNTLLKKPPPYHLPTLIIEVDQFPKLEELPGKAQTWKSVDWDGISAIVTTVSDASHRYKLNIHLRLRQATLGETYFRLYPELSKSLETDKTFFPWPITSSFFALLLDKPIRHPPVPSLPCYGIKNPTLVHVEESLAHPNFLPVEIKINREKSGIAEILSHVKNIHNPVTAFAFSIQLCLQLRNQWLPDDVEFLWSQLFNLFSPIHFENEQILSFLYQIFDRNRDFDQLRHSVGESRLALAFKENAFTFAELSALLELLCVCVQMTGLEKLLVHNGEYKIRCHQNLWLSIPEPTQSWNCIKHFKITPQIAEFMPFQKLLALVLQEHYFAEKVKIPLMESSCYSKLQQIALFFIERVEEPLLLFGYCLYNLCINASDIDQREADLYCLRCNFNYIQFLSPSRLKNLLELNQKRLKVASINTENNLDIDALIKEAPIPTSEEDEELEEILPEIPEKSIDQRIWKKQEVLKLHLPGFVDEPLVYEAFEIWHFARTFSFPLEQLPQRLELKVLFTVIEWKLNVLSLIPREASIPQKSLSSHEGEYFLKKLLDFLNRPYISEENFNNSLDCINIIIAAYAHDSLSKLLENVTPSLVKAFSRYKGVSPKFKELVQKFTPLILKFLGSRSTLWVSITEKASLFPYIFQSCSPAECKKLLEDLLYEHPELNAANEAKVRLLFPLIDENDKPLICKATIQKLSYKKINLEKNEYWLNRWLELNKPNDTKTASKKPVPFINSLTTFLEKENHLTEVRWWNIWSKFFKDKHISYQTWEKPIEKLCRAFIQKQNYKAFIHLFSNGEVPTSEGYKIFEIFLLEGIRKIKKTRSLEELEFLWLLYARSPSIDPRNQRTFLEIFFKSPDKDHEISNYRQVISRAFFELNSGILPHIKRFSSAWKTLWMQFYTGNKWLINESLIQDERWVKGIISSKECQSIGKDTLDELLVASGLEKFLSVWNFYEQLSKKIQLTNTLRCNLVDYFIRVALSPSSHLINETLNKATLSNSSNLVCLQQTDAVQPQPQLPPTKLVEDARTKICVDLVLSNIKKVDKNDNWTKLFDKLVVALIHLESFTKYIDKLQQPILDAYFFLPLDRMEPIYGLFTHKDPIILNLCKEFLIQVIEKNPLKSETIFVLVEMWIKNASFQLYLQLANKLKTPGYVQNIVLLRIYKKTLTHLRKKYNATTPMSDVDQKIALKTFENACHITASKNLPYTYKKYHLPVVLSFHKLYLEVPMPFESIEKYIDDIYTQISRFIGDLEANEVIYNHFKKIIDQKITSLKERKNKSLIKLIGTLHQYMVSNLSKFPPMQNIDYITFITDHLLDIKTPFKMIQTYKLDITKLPNSETVLKNAVAQKDQFLIQAAHSAFHKLTTVLVIQDKEILKTPKGDHCGDIDKALEYLHRRMEVNIMSAQMDENELADCLEIFCKIVSNYKADLFNSARDKKVFYPFELLNSVLNKIPFPIFMRSTSEDPEIRVIQKLLSLYHPRAYVLNNEFKDFVLKKNYIFYLFAQSFGFSESARNVTYYPLFPAAQEQFLLLAQEWDYNKKSNLHFKELEAIQISICKLLSGHFLLTRDTVACSKANYEAMYRTLESSCRKILLETLKEIANMIDTQQKILIANE